MNWFHFFLVFLKNTSRHQTTTIPEVKLPILVVKKFICPRREKRKITCLSRLSVIVPIVPEAFNYVFLSKKTLDN